MIPASIRNNNPGAQEFGFAAKRWGSTSFETLKWTDKKTGKSHTNQCATFPTHQHGGAALFTLLAEGKYYRDKPISEAIATWCGGNSASEYIDHMERATGTKRTALLTEERIRDPDIAVPIAMAIARFEAGPVDLPLDEADWRKVHAMAFAGASAPEPSIDNDVPFQKPEGARRETIAQRVRRAYQAFWASVSAIGSVGIVGALNGEQPLLPAAPVGLKQSIGNLHSWSDLVPVTQWKMLLVGGLVFGVVAGGSALIQRLK